MGNIYNEAIRLSESGEMTVGDPDRSATRLHIRYGFTGAVSFELLRRRTAGLSVFIRYLSDVIIIFDNIQ